MDFNVKSFWKGNDRNFSSRILSKQNVSVICNNIYATNRQSISWQMPAGNISLADETYSAKSLIKFLDQTVKEMYA